jgi:hypothetical protein
LELVGSNVKIVAMPSNQWCWDLEIDLPIHEGVYGIRVLVVIEFLDGILLSIFQGSSMFLHFAYIPTNVLPKI